MKTRGDVVVEDIKMGDTLYEYDYGCCIVSVVVSEPTFKNNTWSWVSKNKLTGKLISYDINGDYLKYAPRLYKTDISPKAKRI